MSERVYKLLNGSELLVSEEVMGLRQTPDGVLITVDGDYVIDDVLELLDHVTQRKNEYREMTYVDLEEKMDLRAERDELEQERDQLRKELEEAVQAMSEPHKNLWFELTNERNRAESERRRSQKQAEANRRIMQDVLYYLQRDSYIPAQDILEQYLELGQEGEGNQDATGEA